MGVCPWIIRETSLRKGYVSSELGWGWNSKQGNGLCKGVEVAKSSEREALQWEGQHSKEGVGGTQ